MYTGLNNANMAQKSIIQRILEQNAVLDKFKKEITNLTEQYIIKGNVFGIVNNNFIEHQAGYFVIECEKNNLPDAIKECTTPNKCIRIIDNKRYQVGSVFAYLNECQSGYTVIDIENQIEINR